VKGRLPQALVNTILRGEEPRNRIARWSRWFPARPAVADDRFQGPGDPYPRHWREFPQPWPGPGPADPADPAVRSQLRDGLAGLPARWRDVVRQRDIEGLAPAEVSERLGITAAQQRAMLNRGRALLRERLARLLAPGRDR
jgi:RNA polymerase sigma-70 factor (ECF subfamily)